MPIPANPTDGEVHTFTNGKEITFTALPLASKGTQVSLEAVLTTAGVNTDTDWQYNSSQFQFNADGTKFYMGSANAGSLYIGTWDLSTPYDLSTQTYNSLSPARSIVYMDVAEGMLFTPDGSKLLQFVNLNNSNPAGSRCRCYVFTLSTPFDLNTISASATDVDLGTAAGLYGSVHGAAWNADGTKIYLAAHTSHLRELALNTPYDISDNVGNANVVNHSPVSLGADITGFWGVGFSTDGAIGYIMESNGATNELHIFDLSTPYEFSTATLNSSVNIDEGTDFNTNYPKKFTMANNTPLIRATVPSIVSEQFIYVNIGSGDVGKWHVTKAAYTGETGGVTTYATVADLPTPVPTGEMAFVTETKKMYFADVDSWTVINDSAAPNAPALSAPAGGALFTTAGLQSWTVPDGVTSICAVCVGAGGYGGARGSHITNGSTGQGGAGGGLGWKNNISVTPGQTISVQVGAIIGSRDSFVIDTSTVAGFAGENGRAGSDPLVETTPAVGGGFVGDGGGQGGSPGLGQHNTSSPTVPSSGGGGAGGYSGAGGQGGSTDAGATQRQGGQPGTGGAGGGGSTGTNDGGTRIGSGPGGGVGLYGETTSGAGGADNTGITATYGGKGGSGGTDGADVIGNGTYQSGGDAGLYGGGGAGHGLAKSARPGGPGAVRIIWGTGRAFPSTNVDLASSTAGETTI